jgi:glycerophosphoryl diester phosphodiesterase
VVLGCVPATLPNLAALVFASLLTVLFLASSINDQNRSVEPGTGTQMSSFAAVVSTGAMRRAGGAHLSPDTGVGSFTVGSTHDDIAPEGERNVLGPSAAFCARPRDPLVCAHGTVGKTYWPLDSEFLRPLPNTVPALAAVVAAGHRCVEVDVSRTKDGHLVALHSRELRLLTHDVHKNVGDLTLADILNLPVPGGGYTIATFAEAMATVMSRGLEQITVDFKEDEILSSGRTLEGLPDVVAETFGSRSQKTTTAGFGLAALSALAAVDSNSGCQECLFWGKTDAIVLEILKENPDARVGFTVANFSKNMIEAGLDSVDPRTRAIVNHAAHKGLSGGADAKNKREERNNNVVAAVQSEMVDVSLSKKLKNANVKKVFAWTVNSPEAIARVANHGVDGIVTDEPEEATRVLRTMRARCGGGAGGGIVSVGKSGDGSDWSGARAVRSSEKKVPGAADSTAAS